MVSWPKQKRREELQVNRFISLYQKLPHGHKFEVVSMDREKPDCRVITRSGDCEFGVELTSVYLSDTSVPSYHLKDARNGVTFMLDESLIPAYQQRLAEKVRKKKELAKKYDLSRPLLLSVFAGDHLSSEMGKTDWFALPEISPVVFSDITPFKEIVFWSMANDHVLSVQSGGNFFFV